MSKLLINKLTELQKTRQERLYLHLCSLNTKKNEYLMQIKECDSYILQRKDDIIQIRKSTYKNKFTNNLVDNQEFRKLDFTVAQINQLIENKAKEQQVIIENLNNLDQEIQDTQAKLRKHYIKIEKYEYLNEYSF